MLSLKQLMVTGDYIYFEFRSTEDQLTKKIYENHYRRYIDTHDFIQKLIEIADLEALYSITGRGMAMYKGEDPSVSRIIARKR